MPTRTTLRVVLLAGSVAAVPATANAAAVVPNAACYVQAGGQVLPIGGTVSGVAAGQNVQLRVARKGVAAGTSAAGAADAAGNIALGIDTWAVALKSGPGKEVEGSLDVIDVATGTALASAPVAIANLDYSVTGKGRLRTWKIQGLAAVPGSAGATYYAHYLNNGKYKGRQKIGTGKGPCGYLSTKRPLTPFSKLGRYDVTIQASKTLNPELPSFKGRVTVTTRYR